MSLVTTKVSMSSESSKSQVEGSKNKQLKKLHVTIKVRAMKFVRIVFQNKSTVGGINKI